MGDPGSILGREDLLEKELASHSSILAWRIPWTEEPVGLQSMVLQRVRNDWITNTHTHIHRHTHTRVFSRLNPGFGVSFTHQVWAAPHKPTRLGLAWLQDWEKCQESAKETAVLNGKGTPHVWSKSWSDAPQCLIWHDSILLSWLGRGDCHLWEELTSRGLTS